MFNGFEDAKERLQRGQGPYFFYITLYYHRRYSLMYIIEADLNFIQAQQTSARPL